MYFYKTFYSLHKEIHQVFAFKYKNISWKVGWGSQKMLGNTAFLKRSIKSSGKYFMYNAQFTTLQTIPLSYFHTRTNVFPFEISCTCV